MEEIKKQISQLLEKGFANEEERETLLQNCGDLDNDEINEIREDLEKVEALPLDKVKPETLEKEEEKEIKEDGQPLTRDERRAMARAKHGK